MNFHFGRQPFCLLRFLQCDRMRSRLFKTQARCFLFSFLLRLRGDAPDDSSQWITLDPGELAVAIDAQSWVSVLDSMAVFMPAVQARRPEQDCDCESQSLPQDLLDFFSWQQQEHSSKLGNMSGKRE